MLESVIAYILRNYLGEYLENVGSDQLSFMFLSGSVEIDNLPVRTDGIRKLGLPIEIKAGFVKKLKLKIPMSALKSQPWEVLVQGLYVIVEPSELGKINEKDEAEFEIATKMKRLQKMEEKWRDEQNQKSSDGSWTSKLLATILENLQVSIEQVHMRYEEKRTAVWPYSLGMKIGKLAAHSTDGNWQQNFTTNRAKSWKLVELTNLEVYTDNISHHDLSFQPLEIPQILDTLGNVSNTAYVGPGHCYNSNNLYVCCNLLQPVSCTAKVIRNRNPQPLHNDDGPRYQLYIELPNVKLSLGKTQYKSLVSTGDSFDMYYRSRAVRKWRPELPVMGNAKLWWQFAFKVHQTRIAERNRRMTWKYISRRLTMLLFYTRAYAKHLESSVSLTKSEQTQLTEIENELSFDDISLMRRISMAKVEESLSSQDGNSTASAGNYTSYWGSWLPLGWGGTHTSPAHDVTQSQTDVSDISKDFLPNFSPSEFEEELDDFLELDSQTSNSFLFRDHQFASICFSMQEGSLSLYDPSDHSHGIVDMNFNHLKLQLDIRPRINYYRFDLSLISIQILDKHHSQSFFPILVEPIRDRQSPTNELFSLCVVKRKSKKYADLSISGRSQPLEVICNMSIVSLLQDFFRLPSIPSGSNLEANLTVIFREKIAALKSYTVKEIRPVIAEALQEERWWSSKHLNVDLEISAPCFVLPENFCVQESRAVIIDLGLFSLKTMDENSQEIAFSLDNGDDDDDDGDDDFVTPIGAMTPQERISTLTPTDPNAVETFADYLGKTLLHKLYDRYQLVINNLQILVTDNFSSESWKMAYKQPSTPFHVLDKLTVCLQLCRRLRFTCDPSESNIAITGALPRLDIHIDEEKFNTILHIQENFLKTILKSPKSSVVSSTGPVKPIPILVQDITPTTSSMTNSSILWSDQLNYWNVEKRRLLMETKLLDASFTFQEVTLSFSHHNRIITQLRVPGIQLNHMQRPYDYKQSLTIQDVFVADAIQRFGTQYDLLIYSQGKDKYFKEDDGNLVYASSPVHSEKSTSIDMFYSVFQVPEYEANALLKLDREVIFQESPNSKFPCNTEIINANFTSLNIIANQETLVEILAFFNSLQLQGYKNLHSDTAQGIINKSQNNLSECRREIYAKFKYLTAKFVCSEGPNDLKEVALINGYGLELKMIVHDQIDLTGYLRGISLDNIMEKIPNQRVLRVGKLEQATSKDNVDSNAFNFEVIYKSDMSQLHLDLQLASVRYTHCSNFLFCVQQCFSDFQYYISKARESLQSAAKDMAYSLFHKGETSEIPFHDEKPSISGEELMISYNILIHAPTVQLENQNNRKDCFVFNLGEITISNCSETEINSKFEHISILVRNIYMLAKIDSQTYRILENMNTKIEVLRKLDANLSMFECQSLKKLANSDLKVFPKAQLVLIASLYENIQINLHKVCFDSLKEILYQNSTVKKTIVVSNPNPLANDSDRIQGDEGFEAILFSVGCSVHNVTLTISQDIGLETKDIVAFSTSNFSASAYREEPYILVVDTRLGGVRGYDLLNDCEKKTFVVTSYLQDYSTNKDAFCSYSTLPEIISYQSPLRSYELSLNESVLGVNKKKYEQKPLEMQNLVSTKVTYVSPSHPEFAEFYQNISLHASVIMNHIHMIVNLQTWVLLLDFFGLTPKNDNLVTPATSVSREQSPVQSVPFIPLLQSPNTPLKSFDTKSPYFLPTPLPDPDEVEVPIPVSVSNSIQPELPADGTTKLNLSLLLNVTINSLIVVFNKSNYPLTCNSATGFKSSVKIEKGDISVVGELGKASLIDLSPHGNLYREKFVTHGENALYFDFFKYVDSDPDLKRECDIRASFRMSSVRYVHTKRFLSENLAFCQHFFQLIDAFQRMKAESSGNVTYSGPNRHPRIKLDVSAASPIIFIPSHGFSPYLFIGELGHVTVSNVFLSDGEKGTWSHRNRGDNSPYKTPERSKSPLSSPLDLKERYNFEKSQYTGPCLLDVMRIELQGNDVFTALFDTKEGIFVREDSRILKEKLNYKVLFEHNLHMPMCHKIPNFRFEVYISDSHCMADKKQMDAFKTFLSKNLGETMEEFERPTSVIRDPIVYENFEDKWIDISFCFIFQHVCLEFVSSRATNNDDIDQFLSRFYMHNTTLLVEIFSDSAKTIDFISRQMSIVDVRYDDYVEAQKPSIYRKVLFPRNDFESDPSTSSLQVEVHVKLSPQSMEYTILLNNLRMILMMDLAIQCWSFVADWSEEHESLFELPDEKTISLNKSETLNSVQPQKSRDLQVKLSVTETDFVIIEDLTAPDTQALVCKGTTVMTFTKNPTYGLTYNLSGVELFSCCYASEEETALSIIDPLLITIEIPRNHTLDHSYPLNIEVQNVSTRLSYNDIKLFAAIFNSISNILEVHNISSNSFENSENKSISTSINPNDSLQTEFEYIIVEDNLKNKIESTEEAKKKEPSTFGEINLHIHEFKLVLIDDCGNCDFPLGDINLERILIKQSLHTPFLGSSKMKLSMNYFNRNVSAWEPSIEPFKLIFEWKRETRFNRLGNVKREANIGYPHYTCTFMSNDRVLINLTSSLLDIMRNTQDSWGQDLSQINDSQPLGIPTSTKGNARTEGSATQLSSLAVRSVSGFNFRKRNPFIPFRLENNTGLPLKFVTLTKNPYKVNHHNFNNSSELYVDSELRDWICVPVGNSVSFEFEKKSKIRHQHLQQRTVHMLLVQVEGWRETKTPISVDQVGIVFRSLKPEITSYPSVKLIFSIKLDGAQKVINVRTPIAIKNELQFEMEIKLSGDLPNQSSHEFSLKPDCYASIPLNRQHSDVFVRPRGWGAQYPSHPLSMDKIERSDLWRVCVPFGEKESKIPKQSFIYTYSVKDTQKEVMGNTVRPCVLKNITLTHPFVIENLLPQEIGIEIVDLNQTKAIKPGASIPIISFTPSRGFSFLLYLDNFRKSHRIDISPSYSVTPTVQNEMISDENNRPLQLKIIVSVEKCPARRVAIMTDYWLINRSNLPLLFREDNIEFESAGQFEEHETARSLVPLPFSFPQSDSSDPHCQVRLGRSQLLPKGFPTWSERFGLLSRGGVVLLYMQISYDTVPVEYQLSVDIVKGSGKYKDSTMVIFENRFQLENLTSLPIQYIQDCQYENDTELIEKFSDGFKQVISPNSVIPFHWPRLDRDHFLRLKYEDIPGVYWTCPFKVIEEDNFVLSMRSKEGNSHFVRVNIRQKGYAFIIRFSDTRNLPPPFIIENYSQVHIQYVQASISLSNKHVIKPGNIRHYAWDEIHSEQKLKLFVDDIDESVIYDPSNYKEQPKLYYENFFYIALYDTFTNESRIPGRELVLNVNNQTKKVFFARKSFHPSQLWRKTGAGKIEHVSSQKQGLNLVLDVEDPRKSGAFSGTCTQLMLREKEDKRDPTQLWEFTDGLLTLASIPYQCVCAKILPVSIDSCDAVLVSNPKFSHNLNIKLPLPPNHHIRILKAKPGSGVLSVQISTKGPSNIIRITDINPNYHHLNITPLNWPPSNLLPTSKHMSVTKLLQEDDADTNPFEFISSCNLSKGIGLSLVGNREEIIFASFDNISGIYKRTHKSELIEFRLFNVQVDNQLCDNHSSPIFYVEDVEENRKYAFSFALERQFDSSPGFHLFKFLHIELPNYVLTIDERILLKLLEFFGIGQKTNVQQSSLDISSSRSIENFSEIKYFFFRDIFINSTKLKTSMLTVSNLPPHLQAIKSQLGLKFVKFQALIVLSEYQRKHSFYSLEEHFASIRNHYKSNLFSQAYKVLGSIDFLGNPLGLFNDVTKGITGLITLRHGFTGLLKDVTHGLSDSASKITGSAGNLASYMTFDKQFQKEREEMVPVAATSSILHLGAGLSSFTSGLLGVVTSIPTSSYQGAQEGVFGFVTGIGKGVAGTFAKPLAGALDLVSGTSAALRAQTLSSSGSRDIRRLPRCCVGPGGALPLYSERSAKGLYFFNQFVDWDSGQGTFNSLEDVRHTSDEYIQVVITTGALYFIDMTSKQKELQTNDVKLVVKLSRLKDVRINSKRLELSSDRVHFAYNLELEVLYDDITSKTYPIPCHSQEVAIKLKQIFNYAKILRDEEGQVIPISNFEVYW